MLLFKKSFDSKRTDSIGCFTSY